jgi:hypothetical protein
MALSVLAAPAARAATVSTSKGCYLVGQPVTLSGSGFGDARSYAVSVDGVYFGESTTAARGGFRSSLRPGGLGAGAAQSVELLEATDGVQTGDTQFTVTRPAGARFVASGGSPGTLRAPFEVWGFSLNGTRRPVFLHYVSPAGSARDTVALGDTSGQCGYLRTPTRTVFPFTPSVGKWTFQIDTSRSYSVHPGGPVARISVSVA